LAVGTLDNLIRRNGVEAKTKVGLVQALDMIWLTHIAFYVPENMDCHIGYDHDGAL